MKFIIALFMVVALSAMGVTQNKVWRVPNGGSVPSWGPLNLTGGANAISNQLPIASGGTGSTSLYDNVTIDQGGTGTSLEVKALGITTTQLANGSVTKPKLSSTPYQISSSSGNWSSIAGAPVSVTNLAVTITATGSRPVVVGLMSDGSGNASRMGAELVGANSTSTIGYVTILKGAGNELARYSIHLENSAFQYRMLLVPTSSASTIDVPAAGSVTYYVEAWSIFGGVTDKMWVKYAKLYAVEF